MRQRMGKGKAGIEDLLWLMLEGFDLATGALILFLELQGGALTREGQLFRFDIST